MSARRPVSTIRAESRTFFFMIDGRTAMAKHTKWVGALLFAILALTVFMEALG